MQKYYHTTIFIFAFIVIFFTSSVMQAQTIQEPNKKMKEWSDEEFNQWFYHFINKTAIDNALQKPTAGEDRKISNHNGNKIETLFSNFGSISLPRQAPALVWPTGSGRSYGYEFAPIVAAEVIGKNEEVLHIVTDALVDGGERANPNLSTGNVMGWEPLPGYSREGQPDIAMSDKPDSWPESWGGKWNGLFGKGIITADQESFWVMDDRFNDEFDYYPLTSGADSIRGLGIRMTCRGYQYAAGPAEDIILFIYDLKLREDVKPLDKVFVAMLGDAHVGGGADFGDDYAAFNKDINLLYTWDKPNSTNDYGLEKMGYLGFAFIASPGNATNGIDDDDDGFVDESQYDGIDNDGDWHATDEEAAADLGEEDTSNGIDDDGDGRIDDFGDADKKSDDVGADGIPNTGDYGEGDGVPTAGEPDFDETDFDEIDEIGVTSFDAPIYGDFSASQDEVIWNKIQPGTFGTPANDADNVFIFGCGPFSLQPGEKMRYVIMVSVGEDYEDLLNNTNKSYEILSRSFSFTKAPDPPNVTVIPGDKKVTLYWDDIAEKSVDPLLGSDFEGYKIYRSEDNGVTWGDLITSNQGVVIGYKPLAQFDLKDNIKGNFQLGADGVQFYLGNDSGLKHIWTDCNVMNGKKYLYAVSSYDTGSVEFKIFPAETPRKKGASNVVEVNPGGFINGYQEGIINYTQLSGNSNSSFKFDILNPMQVDENTYTISINDSSGPKSVSVANSQGVTLVENMTSLNGEDFTLFDGIRLWVYDWQSVICLDENTGFTASSKTNYNVSVLPPGSSPKYLKPTRYKIIFYDSMVDSSYGLNVPIPFKVYDEFDGTEPEVVVNQNGWFPEDMVQFLEEINGSFPIRTWRFTLASPEDTTITPLAPTAGDTLIINISRPFTSEDKYQVSVQSPQYNQNGVNLDKIAVVPNPYVVAAGWETPPTYNTGRGERRIDFINLPPNATIRIFTISGELVKKIIHSGEGIYNATESWDLLSEEGREIAFGIYIYHVEVPGIGEKMGKLGIIK